MADAENQKAQPSTAPPGDEPDAGGMLQRVKSVRQESTGANDLFTSLCAIICESVLVLVIFLVAAGISLSVPITMIVIGAIYKDQCSAEPYIPIFLIVSGSFTIISIFLSMFAGIKQRRKMDRGDDDEGAVLRSCARCLYGLISIFMLAWFIAGNVWIYRTHEPNYNDVNADDYCHKTLYLFSFWLLNVTYILMGLSCCLGCCGCFASRSDG
ncbi:transmembrane protein 272-like isoform X1 [Ptychodera flava]|uniref:transmembrane protein 272-like isoform X1 n=1 Tax=Ptychodera flava TaxID=63121 RepID=UPI00396A289B